MAKRLQRKSLPVGPRALILASGFAFFNDLDGEPEDNLPLLQKAWNTPEIKAAVYDRLQKRGQTEAPWAELEFGK
jgi:hypothetical protein